MRPGPEISHNLCEKKHEHECQRSAAVLKISVKNRRGCPQKYSFIDSVPNLLCLSRESYGERKQLEDDVGADRKVLFVAHQLEAVLLTVCSVIKSELIRHVERVHEGVLSNQLDLHFCIVEMTCNLPVKKNIISDTISLFSSHKHRTPRI